MFPATFVVSVKRLSICLSATVYVLYIWYTVYNHYERKLLVQAFPEFIHKSVWCQLRVFNKILIKYCESQNVYPLRFSIFCMHFIIVCFYGEGNKGLLYSSVSSSLFLVCDCTSHWLLHQTCFSLATAHPNTCFVQLGKRDHNQNCKLRILF